MKPFFLTAPKRRAPDISKPPIGAVRIVLNDMGRFLVAVTAEWLAPDAKPITKTWRSATQLCRYMAHSKTPKRWFAYDTGQFKTALATQGFGPLGWLASLNPRNGTGPMVELPGQDQAIKIHLRQRLLTITSLHPWFHGMSWAAACEEAGLPRGNGTPRSDALTLIAMVVKLAEVVHKYGGSLRPTPAATAYAMYMRDPVDGFGPATVGRNVKPLRATYAAVVRRGYFGGWTAVGRRRHKHAYRYDINSLFPVCALEPVPVGEPCIGRVKPSDITRTLAPCFIECEVDLSNVSSPHNMGPLPVRDMYGHISHPTRGMVSGVWASCLLAEAIEVGARVLSDNPRGCSALIFDYVAPIMRGFMAKMLAAKATATGLERWVLKQLMNTLYGKWGERPDRMEYIWGPSNMDELLPKAHLIFNGTDAEYGAEFRREVYRPRLYHIPEISAWIAALGMARMVREVSAAQARGQTVLYMDTDSLILDSQLPAEMVDPNIPGMFKAAGEGAFRSWGPKHYEIGDDLKWAGVPQVARSTGTWKRPVTLRQAVASPRASGLVTVSLRG